MLKTRNHPNVLQTMSSEHVVEHLYSRALLHTQKEHATDTGDGTGESGITCSEKARLRGSVYLASEGRLRAGGCRDSFM